MGQRNLNTDRSIGINYDGKPLAACTRYYVTIHAEAENGETAAAETEFETGLLDGSMKAWDGAQWIGAPEYYVCSDAMGIFSIESIVTISERGTAGLVFGANDARLLNQERNEKMLCGENYIRYQVSLADNSMSIFRVGYDENDSADKPFAVVPVTEVKAGIPFRLKIDVAGNCASAYIDGNIIDEMRQLNPAGNNDVSTYPRLCDIGYYAAKGTRAHFDGIRLSFLRKPAKAFY